MSCRSQLVELQERVPDFERHGVALFAITRDTVDVLAAFAARHGLTYPLLSDEWGRLTRALGLLDVQIRQHNEAVGIFVSQEQLDDVAYPGSFLLDGDGIVRERRFPSDVRRRESAAALLEEGFGVEVAPTGSVVEARSMGVSVRVWADVASSRCAWRP